MKLYTLENLRARRAALLEDAAFYREQGAGGEAVEAETEAAQHEAAIQEQCAHELAADHVRAGMRVGERGMDGRVRDK